MKNFPLMQGVDSKKTRRKSKEMHPLYLFGQSRFCSVCYCLQNESTQHGVRWDQNRGRRQATTESELGSEQG